MSIPVSAAAPEDIVFGTYRFVLATLVVQSHLWPYLADWTGYYAVFAFYLLSGYLMTFVLNEVYGADLGGRTRFLANRALRLYPAYALALAAGAFAAAAAAPEALAMNRVLRFPSSPLGWLSQVLLVGLSRESLRLVPTAWSLDIEVVFYVFMALGLSRSRGRSLLWWSASLVVTAVLLARSVEFHDRYYSLAGASLPFSSGAVLYHLRQSSLFPRQLIRVAPLLFLAHLATAERLWIDPEGLGIYLSTAAAFFCTFALSRVRRSDLAPPLCFADAILGDLSYPLFLFHWPVTMLLVSIGAGAERGPRLFCLVLLLSTLISFVVHLFVEKRVGFWRERLRLPRSGSS